MDLNPFIFNKPVDPDQLIDRGEEARHLLELAEGGHASRLSAPRRYGKTSLLRRVGRDADLAGMAYVEVDFYGALSLTDVVSRLEEAYERLRSPLRRVAIAAIKTLRPKLGVGAGSLRLEAQPVPAADANRIVSGLLDLPLALFERTGTRTLVAFDEFQALLAVGGGIEGLFRSRIQRHGDAASYIFAGSHPGLMQQLFGERERPFFGQARVLRLEPLADADLVAYIGDRFEKGGRDATPVLESLAGEGAGAPSAGDAFRPPPLGADAAWRGGEPRDLAGDPGGRLRRAGRSAGGDLGRAGRQRAGGDGGLALSPTSLSGLTLERFNLTKGGARHAREKLIHMGHLQKLGDHWQPVDPLLTEWIARVEHRGGRGR